MYPFALLTVWANLWAILGKPDNIPIAGMMVLVAFFSAVAFYQARKNDRLREKNPQADICYPDDERDLPNKVFVWPYLLRIEFLAAIGVMILLTVWSITLDAPTEELANPAQTPNPSKAPWYFLGLQEMLVYFDPWLAGVVFPTLIIIGLMIIPYVDVNPKGSGTWTIKDRKFAIFTFCFGFYLWVILIFIGTMLRGPGWVLFWPWQKWDHQAVMYESNRDLSMLLFGVDAESIPGSLIGAVAVLAYFAVTIGGTYVLARTRWRNSLHLLGNMRFFMVSVFFWLMMALPIKMILKLGFNVKYIMKIKAINLAI